MTAPTELDERALEAAVRECARITAPEISDDKFEDHRSKRTAAFKNTSEEISRIIRAYLSALPASGAGWRDAEAELPPLEQVVLTRRASGYDGSDVYAFGARVDDGEGWLWGERAAYGGGVRPDQNATWNSIKADDDYRVTHWMPLPAAPDRRAGE